MSKGDFINNGNNDKNARLQPQEEQTPQEKNYLFFFISAGCFALGALSFILAFVLSIAIKGIGTYLLFASMICELASVTFLNAQKRKYNFKWIMVLRVASYVIMGAALVIVIFGLSVAAK